MAVMSYRNIQEFLASKEYTNLPELHVTVLRNVTVEAIEPFLKYHLGELGFQAKCYFGEYDNIFQEAVGRNKKTLNEDTDCVLIFTKLENLSWKLSRTFGLLSPEDIEREKNDVATYVDQILEGIRRQTHGTILWFGVEMPLFPSLGILDCQGDRGQGQVIYELNHYLRKKLQETKNSYFVDTNNLMARVGGNDFYDSRFWHIAKAPYSKKALEEMAKETRKVLGALKGKNKKCLVLDCDNVLWGGVVGEDGLPGILLGKDYPGSPYFEFQVEVLNLLHRGVIVALCSKNNEADVWEVFERHPDMVLRKEHIASYQINWDDKPLNIRKIAASLNIGLDSLVFIDDSEFEVDMVRKEVPEVTVLHFDVNKAVLYRDQLAGCGLFDTLTLSDEDKHRHKAYQEESERNILKEKATDLESYLRGLNMVLEVRACDAISLPRIAQLTQKTNQFNLTTRRYTEHDISVFSASKDVDIFYARLRDRFGDMGIIGVCIIRYLDNRAELDSFLLSCRALGRTVEQEFLNQCLKKAKDRGCHIAVGVYVPTVKNSQVSEFFANQGFSRMSAEGIGEYRFQLDLPDFQPADSNYFSLIRSEHFGGEVISG